MGHAVNHPNIAATLSEGGYITLVGDCVDADIERQETYCESRSLIGCAVDHGYGTAAFIGRVDGVGHGIERHCDGTISRTDGGGAIRDPIDDRHRVSALIMIVSHIDPVGDGIHRDE